MAQGKLPALVEGGFDWVDARDVAQGAIRAEEQAPIGAKYLLSGHWATIRDLAKLTEEIAGTPAPRFVCPTWLARTGAPVVTAFNQLTGNRQLYTSVSIRALSNCNHNISHERATRELNYHPRPLRETLIDTFRWFQETGMLDSSIKTKGRYRAEVMNELTFFHYLIIAWFALAVVIFVTLFFIVAPYGRHTRPKWGPHHSKPDRLDNHGIHCSSDICGLLSYWGETALPFPNSSSWFYGKPIISTGLIFILLHRRDGEKPMPAGCDKPGFYFQCSQRLPERPLYLHLFQWISG